ncbi:MAG: hypothetical protein JWP91_743 [Fibrobacteres bacterium]|nr:hypothetical protein [Fibrobacterota bacterium]
MMVTVFHLLFVLFPFDSEVIDLPFIPLLD